jgi:tetrahydromethanopterin S-methyltransferase subunit C
MYADAERMEGPAGYRALMGEGLVIEEVVEVPFVVPSVVVATTFEQDDWHNGIVAMDAVAAEYAIAAMKLIHHSRALLTGNEEARLARH